MNNFGALPNWVDKSTSPIQGSPIAKSNFGVTGAQSGIMNATGATTPTQPQKINPNAWDGLGPNTNQPSQSAQPSNVGNESGGMFGIGSPQMQSLPPQIQQFMQMFSNMNGSGFTGFQPVANNPFQGSNLQQWGQQTNQGIYGGS